MPASFDFVIVGAGIVGLSVARELKKRLPEVRIVVLEKEQEPGLHASGRNSGVMHCGIYYGADTLKAKVCAEGAKRMLAFAQEEDIAYNQCGKVILATSDSELPTLEKLLKNATSNGIAAEKIDTQRLHDLEPYAAPGTAIYCPATAVIDSKAVIKRLREKLERLGVFFMMDCAAVSPVGKGQLRTSQDIVHYGKLFNCAGAYADKIAKSFGFAKDYTLIPFKGIYWKLSPNAAPRVRANIYPVPDISVPFLGVHLTRVISNEVYVGPTAIPVLGRENYHGTQGLHSSEAFGIVGELTSMYLRNENNFRKLAHAELAKYHKSKFLAAARKLLPSLKGEDLLPTKKSGIRPQLINHTTRKLEMDYILERGEDSVHVLNAISPAFTSSFAFAEHIVTAGGIA